MNTFRLDREDTAILIVDIQERLAKAMNSERLARVLNRTAALAQGARTLGLPVLYTEQYPKGLGPTHASLLPLLEGAPRFEKLQFSSARPEVLSALGTRRHVLIAGMEAHICVLQTARDLLEKGFHPVILRDAVLSRTDEDREAGFALVRELGATVTTVEAALFELLGAAGTPEFKAISQAVK